MRSSSFMMSCLLLVSYALTTSTAHAAVPNIESGRTIFTEGKGDAAACQGCHGEKALGNDSMGAPRLANIGQYYIAKQLGDFADDRRTPEGAGAAMNGFAKALNEQDRLDLAGYLDTLEYAEELSDLKALAADGVKVGKPDLGQIIVTKGIKGKVPACQDCHGFNGRASRFPQINQQRYVYLYNQLNNWRSDSRANDPMVGKTGIMRGIAKKLSDEDIENIAAFLSVAPRVAPGDINKMILPR
jgi:cytochrome c553